MRMAPVFACLILVLSAAAPGQTRAAPAATPRPSAAPWVDMDYGPFMSLTLEAPRPAGNFSYKGIVVPLKPDRSAAVVFDTDLLRWSAGVGRGVHRLEEHPLRRFAQHPLPHRRPTEVWDEQTPGVGQAGD